MTSNFNDHYGSDVYVLNSCINMYQLLLQYYIGRILTTMYRYYYICKCVRMVRYCTFLGRKFSINKGKKNTTYRTVLTVVSVSPRRTVSAYVLKSVGRNRKFCRISDQYHCSHEQNMWKILNVSCLKVTIFEDLNYHSASIRIILAYLVLNQIRLYLWITRECIYLYLVSFNFFYL